MVDHALPDRQPDPRPVPHRAPKHIASFGEIVAGVEHAVDLGAILRPLLNLVEVALVRLERVVGLLIRRGRWSLRGYPSSISNSTVSLADHLMPMEASQPGICAPEASIPLGP
jgi:hypothetical protein